MLVFHNAIVDGETSGTGAVSALDRATATALRLRDGVTSIPFLHEVVDIVRDSDTVLQIDLKAMRRLTAAQAWLLTDALVPLGKRALIGSRAWWNVRRFDPAQFTLAFDPTMLWFYYEALPGQAVNEAEAAARRLALGYMPVRREAHGMFDDSPLAQLGHAGPDYFAERLIDVLGLVPGVGELMVDHVTIRRMATFGFALGRELGKRGVELSAWTVKDEGVEITRPLVSELFALGATTITSSDPLAVASYFAEDAETGAVE
jgi:hypothetical protein